MAPGLLSVTMQPHGDLPAASFHDWYNNEHGPTRLRLPFITNGIRYRATDSTEFNVTLPEWLAIYDVADMAEMQGDAYLRLRRDDVKSSREKETMKKIAIDRRLYDLVDDEKCAGYVAVEDDLAAPEQDESQRRVLVAITQTVAPGSEAEFGRWYAEEHIPLLAKVPGWLRTRRFVSSAIEPKDITEYLCLHEYAAQNGLDGSREMAAATNTAWRTKILDSVVRDRARRVYRHCYTFGGAPRDLSSITAKDARAFTSPDTRTRVLPSTSTSTSTPAIESFITTPDGVTLPYRLEGSASPSAPLILLANSILTHYSIWDGFVTSFFSTPENRAKYRILRYLSRGRLANTGPEEKPVTMDVLSSDALHILDTLRVARAECLIGVSLGGATVLNAALKYPGRMKGFIACDTNAVAPAGNPAAWTERIGVAEREGAVDLESGEAVVGGELAEVTVRRWFVPEAYDGGAKEEVARRVTEMVRGNSLEGFRKGVRALFEYDVREQMKAAGTAHVKAAFVVGSADGALPGTMKGMSEMMEGSEYAVVQGAGHLPMVEQPEAFRGVVEGFLKTL